MKKVLLPMVLLAALAGVASAELTECQTQTEAFQIAQTENRQVMVLYTGTDWCPACIYLDNKILKQPEFEKALGDRLVMVTELFPRTPEARDKVGDKEMERRLKEMDSYKITSLPCAVFCDSKGLPYAVVQGAERDTTAYVKRVEEALALRGKRDAAFAVAAGKQGMERAKALAAALEVLPEVVRDKYTDVLTEIEKLDPDNTLGYKGLATRQARIAEINDAYRALVKSFNGKLSDEEITWCRGEVEKFMATYSDMDPEMKQLCYRLISDGYALQQNVPMVYKYTCLALDAAPDSPLAQHRLRSAKAHLESRFPEECKKAGYVPAEKK